MAVAPGQVHHHSFKMMGDGLNRPQSALLRGVQITEFKDSRVNPQPIVLEESDILLEEYLSPSKLRLLTGVDNLESVQSLEMRVDTSDTSLGNFGAMLPNLSQLKLSNSVIRSIRDVGSSLRSLQVLWMSRCELQELDGLSSMSRLTELYLSYNEIADLSPLSMLENLEILDLEGNNIEDICQIQYLELCSRLRHLTLEANPICVMSTPDSQQLNYDYRGTIRKMLPQLQYLDDEPVVSSDPGKKTNVFDEDWAYLDELQKDLGLQTLNSPDDVEEDETAVMSGRPSSAARLLGGYRPGSALRPSTGMRPLTRQGSPGARPRTRGSSGSGGRPGSAGRPGTANRPVSGEENEVADSASVLTKGSVICGNPVRALRSRRANSFTPPGKETTPKLFAQHCQGTDDGGDMVPGELSDATELQTELQQWREHHSKVVERIAVERAPQVLTIVPDEAEVWSGSDCESDEDSGALRAASTACHKPPSRQAICVEPPPTSPAQHGRPHTPEFRARRLHLPGNKSPVNDSTNGTVWTQRHDESFDDDEVTSPDISRQARQTTTPQVRSGTIHSSPVAPIITGKPTVPAIPRHSPLDRHSRNEALSRPGRISEVSPKPPSGAPRPHSGAALPPRVASSRTAPPLPSQLRIKRQLPTPPSQRPGPPN